MRSESRNEAIDAFRGIAIISVLLFHYMVRWAPPWNATNLYGYHRIYPTVLGLGALGVHLFFVVSGLVITMTVLRSSGAVEFLVKRFARLYPAFLCGLVLTVAAMAAFGPAHFRISPTDALANLTMDASDLHHKFADGAYWSLVVEIKFYALVALAFLFLREWFWLGVVAAAMCGLALFEAGHARDFLMVPYAPFFLFGMAIWYGLFERKKWPALILLGTSLMVYLGYHHSFELAHLAAWMPHLWLPFFTGILVLLVARGGALALWPLSYIGRISYSLYLIHQYIGVTIIARLTGAGMGDMLAFVIALSCLLVAAALMFRFVEQPGQKAVMAAYHLVRLQLRERLASGAEVTVGADGTSSAGAP